eukprot:Awhi_evm1s6114
MSYNYNYNDYFIEDLEKKLSPTSHSQLITSFRQTSSCWDCAIERYNLNRSIVQKAYSGNDFFANLNKSLENSKRMGVEQKMYTLLLAESIFVKHENLPHQVYRGVRSLTPALIKQYEKRVGSTIFSYGFTSTSSRYRVAKDFAGSSGYIFVITFARGKRDCVADISGVSQFAAEKELLITCNAEFRVDSVDKQKRHIELTLVNDSKCPKERPNKSCLHHKEGNYGY